jgi:prepilin-type N-terminal cleavage/methylation domain-containing protein
MSERRGDGAFTVIELLFTVTVIGILAAMVIPGLSKAKAVSTEVSTIGSMRAIAAAQATFAASCAAGYYAPSVTWLTKAATGGKAGFLGSEFSSDTVDRLNYRIRLTAGPVESRAPASCNGLAAGQSVSGFFIAADPLVTNPSTGTRHFATNADNRFFQSTNNVSPFYSGVPPAPAIALK